jgi:hypothetical protein
VNAAFLRLWGWPLGIAAVSASGLVSALLFDGWGDVWSWLALGLPAGVCAWCALPRRGDKHSTS